MISRTGGHKAVLNGLMVITGGPGTGKTTTINTIIKYFEMEGLKSVWQRRRAVRQSGWQKQARI